MSSLPLRNQIIRLAQSKPELREQLLPLLKMASTKLDITVESTPLGGVGEGTKITYKTSDGKKNVGIVEELRGGKVHMRDPNTWIWPDMILKVDGPKFNIATVSTKQMIDYLAAVLSDMGLEVDIIGNSRLMVYLDCGAVTSLSVTLTTVDSSNVLGQSARIFQGPNVQEQREELPFDEARAVAETTTLKNLAPIIRFIKHFTSRCAIQQGGGTAPA